MMSDIVRSLSLELVVVLIFMAGAFVVAQRLRRYDVADIAWGLVFIAIAVTAALAGAGTGARVGVATLLVSLWGLRLAAHIYNRFRRKPSEDRRYADMRATYTAHPVVLPYTKIFLSQGLLALVVTLPVTIIGSTSTNGLSLLDAFGIVVWVVGFFFESRGDAELTTFVGNPGNKGKLLTTGLWKYTRHPNYFGEVTQWWAIGLIGLSVPYGWLGLIGPAVISVLIIFVSGVPLLEKHYAGRSDWEAYKKHTNMLVPWFPQK